jgi:peptide chain release factor 2
MNVATGRGKDPAILIIHAGTGGLEAEDFAAMLLRMYLRWARRQAVPADLAELTAGGRGGVKTAVLRLASGHLRLRAEAGVHRLQRVSPHGGGERHTSFCLVEVWPGLGETDLAVPIREVRMDLLRGSGPGGQHRNKVETGVRLVHRPTGTTVVCTHGRSQWVNRQAAWAVLRSRLAALSRPAAARADDRDGAQWGRQIRTYTFNPVRGVRDHRTGRSTGEVARVLDGDLAAIGAE